MGIKSLESLGIVVFRLNFSSCCLFKLTTVGPSWNMLEPSHFRNPNLPSEVTHRGDEHVCELHKTHIPQDTGIQMFLDLKSCSHKTKPWSVAGSSFSSIKYISLQIRNKYIIITNVCFWEHSLLNNSGLFPMMCCRSTLRALLCFSDLTSESVLFFSFPFHLTKSAFSKYKGNN